MQIPVPMRRHIGHVSFMVAVALTIMGIWMWRDPPLCKAFLVGAFALTFLADLVLPPKGRSPR